MKIEFGLAKYWLARRQSVSVRISALLSARHSFAPGLLAGALFLAAAMICSPAYADIVVADCGALIQTRSRTFYNDSFTTSSSTYVAIPGAVIGINVPSGQTRCVRVKFSSSATCAVTNSIQGCYIRVLGVSDAGAYTFDPAAGFAAGTNYSAHSFEWIGRLSAGAYKIRVQAAANDIAFTLGNWVFIVDVAK